MDSVGAILKGAREEKKLSLGQVSSDTHILPGYIQAIEENRFQELPGEAYCAGFIGTLAHYYGLDRNHLVALFKGVPDKKKSEPDSEENLNKPVIRKERKKIPPLILVLMVLAVLAAVMGFIFSGKKSSAAASSQAPAAVEEKKPNVYVMDEVLFERSFAEKDIVRVNLGAGAYDISCQSVGASVVLSYRKGNLVLAPSKELVLDLDGDTKNDVKVSVKDVNPEARTAVIRIDRAIEAPVPPPLPAVPVASEPGSIIMHDKGTVNILVSPVKRNFILEASFSGPCMFRYQADDAASVEKYCKAGDQVRLEVSDSVKVWLSNAGNAKFLLGDAEITLGQKGDVTSEKIGWEETADKAYNLSIVSMH